MIYIAIRQHKNVVASIKTWANRVSFNNDGNETSDRHGLRFFRGIGIEVTPTPLDIRLICFARPFAHNTLRKIWNYSTSNWTITSLSLEKTQTCFFSKSSTHWHPLFIRNFCIPKAFSKSLKSSINFSIRSLDFSKAVRLMQAFKLWKCVFASESFHCFSTNFGSILMRLHFFSSNCLFMSHKFVESLIASFSNFSFSNCRVDLLGPINYLETYASSNNSFTTTTCFGKKILSLQGPSNIMQSSLSLSSKPFSYWLIYFEYEVVL